MKIRTKISSTYSIIFIIIAISAGILASYFSYVNNRKILFDYLETNNHAKAEHIRTFIKDKENTGIILSLASVYLDFLKEPINSKQYSLIKEKVQKRLNRTIGSDSEIYEILIIGADGKTLISTDPTQVGNDESKDDYFVEGLKGVFFKDVYFMTNKNIPTYAVSVPIRDTDGTLLGVSMVRYKSADFYSIIKSENGLGQTEENYLVNSSKFFISPSLFVGEKMILKEKAETVNVNSCFSAEEIAYTKQYGYLNSPNKIVEHTTTGKDYRNIDVYNTHAYIPETGWCLITKIDSNEISGLIKTEIYYLIAIIIISIIIFYVISLFISQYITKSIVKLTENADKIKNGKYDEIINIETNDEIGILSSSFTKMAKSIKDYSVNLENKVKEQTKLITDRTVELDNQKISILNVLDDLKNEKNKIEETVKLRTAELSKEKSRLLSSINAFNFGFIISSNEGDIITSNPVLSKIFNIKETPHSVSDLAKLFKNFDLLKTFTDCVGTQETIEISDIIYGEKTLKISFAPVVNVNKVIDYVILIEDITESKILDRSKEEFLAVASHELRTPLTAIRGNSDMILDSFKDQKISNPDVKEMLTDINSASVRLIGIVNSFLEVSRLEQGRIETKLESFDLSPIINKVINEMYSVIGRKKISLTYIAPPISLPNVYADKVETEQVFINLISNAIKYTDEGSITVSIETNDGFTKIKVIDTGKGIDEKNKLLLFKKFQQAGGDIFVGDYATSSGLGLYISKLLVKNMGGDIGLEQSTSGSGSTFFFTLPTAV